MTTPRWLNLRDIIAIHGEILAESGGQSGILNQSALDSTLAKAQNLYYYNNQQSSLYQLAAAYGYGFIKNHCFVDGNKRIALIVVYVFLAINGIHLNASDVEAARYFWELAASQQNPEIDLEQLAQWLQTHSQNLTDTP